jgi:peptide/nickel transport system ATP-binding protein
VTIQAQILELLNELKAKLGMAVMLITHDMGVHRRDRAARASSCTRRRSSEERPWASCSRSRCHPYTQGLLRSIPAIDLAAGTSGEAGDRFPARCPTLRGAGEARLSRSRPRCSLAKPMHFENTPALKEVRPGHKVACFLY